ncbi:MAG: bifunctional serine/threonine-protein kinase/formylglycine-generating enzyme family protein [Myxococcota bacterium]|nr:bifunctional serine/threonine-protein kinase/formylglycine-generating enzyme family protein [Myxococcota bacterium]
MVLSSSRPGSLDTEPTLQGRPDDLSTPNRSSNSSETETTAFFSVLDRLLPLPLGQGSENLIDEGEIGRGGMAEVRRVRDPRLGRTMAQKVILKSAETDPLQTARFLEEAQITSQLQHPGVVPVHALGRRPDGRPYFTMKEVRGASLADRIRQVHEASGEGDWGTTDEGWSLQRLVEVFRRVCETVAYAHSRSIIHRDLKPDNIMTGDFGEVLVLDWGLAKVGDSEDLSLLRDKQNQAELSGAPDLANLTLDGHISGTPAFMPPEQARQEPEKLGPTADVYALGAVLYVVLTGSPPYQGTPLEILGQLIHGPPVPPSDREDHRAGAIPEELEKICIKATATAPEDRYADAGRLGEEVASWLEGTRQRERALELVARADRLAPEIDLLRTEAALVLGEARSLLEQVDELADEEEKLPGWTLEDRAAEWKREAERKSHEFAQLLHAALTQDPGLGEAKDRLAAFHRRLHSEAEERGDWAEADRHELAIRAHDRGAHKLYLAGDGALTLHTDPPGAVVRLSRYEGSRRLRPVDPQVIGRTPLAAYELKMGRYLVELEAPGRLTVRYPVWIQRLHHWSGIPPGESQPQLIYLPYPEEVGDDEALISGGWFPCGGDPEAPSCLPAKRIWVDSFVMRRFPVTNEEYLLFLNDLVDQGKEEAAMVNVPRELTLRRDAAGEPLYGRDAKGHFFLQEDADGDLWQPDWPVTMVSHAQGSAYAKWLASRTGKRWRLPSELEWEKAAVGVDARIFPWGDGFDPTWCNMGRSRRPHRLVIGIAGAPRDVSPYGVRHMAGNTRDACFTAPDPLPDRWKPTREPQLPEDGSYFVRGGSWWAVETYTRAGARSEARAGSRYPNAGFRLVRPFVPVD